MRLPLSDEQCMKRVLRGYVSESESCTYFRSFLLAMSSSLSSMQPNEARIESRTVHLKANGLRIPITSGHMKASEIMSAISSVVGIWISNFKSKVVVRITN